ncbi:hypothetical protein [Actinoplanes xinjiangensis]|uniref:hypothetical protein n=1 Tax=Actinoplanes xinjiangensis TaxID=512350 RepID=UPI003438FF90
MAGFVSQFVSYSQYQICSAEAEDLLDIYTVGDELLHGGGPDGCTGFTGIHTGDVEMRVVVHTAEPPPDGDWDTASETTLWCPDGELTVIGLLSEGRDALTAIPAPAKTLIRVRVYARNRIHESVREPADPPEQHEIHVWPVDEETAPVTLWSDESRQSWTPNPAKAAEWAMLQLLDQARRGVPDDGVRVTVVRTAPRGIRLATTIPAGDLAIRLRPSADATTLTWEWALADRPIFPDPLTVLPDGRASAVHLRGNPEGTLTLRHAGVPGGQAVLLGLIWDHLLTRPAAAAYAWQPPLRAKAGEATRLAETSRRERDERLAAGWGGTVPTDRMRAAGHLAKELARMDRPLLDRLAAFPDDRLRAVALWTARQALDRAGLLGLDWIADALATVETGEPLPAVFADRHGRTAYERMLADPQLPQTMIDVPGRRPVLLAAAAFGVLTALTQDDPLAAAAGTVVVAASAHGSGLLGDLRAAF